MANTADVSFTPREISVMAEIMSRTTTPTFTAAEWKEIATKAGITDGDIGRNAKYSFAQAKRKMGIKDGATTKSPGAGTKRKNAASKDEDDVDGDVDSGATPTKKARPGRKPKQSKLHDHIEVKDESQEDDEE